jgi:hypothetical protein
MFLTFFQKSYINYRLVALSSKNLREQTKGLTRRTDGWKLDEKDRVSKINLQVGKGNLRSPLVERAYS